jgi:ribosomal protein L3 glutamine methyltransferase
MTRLKDQETPSHLTLSDAVSRIADRLSRAGLHFGHGTDNPDDEALWLVLEALDACDTDSEINWERQLTETQWRAVGRLCERRIETRRPLAYLLNRAWFAGEPFYVDERVIVPRSHLGEWIPERFSPWVTDRPHQRLLDLCAGSGCIAIALAKAFPEAKVDAVDVSADALAVARINVENHQLQDRIQLIESNLFERLADRRYDLIVCNPPYVDADEIALFPPEHRCEPDIAFRAGAAGTEIIHRILNRAADLLLPHGVLVVEAGSAALALEARYPRVPFTWLTSSNGDSVVFLFSREELIAHRDAFVDQSDSGV